MWASRDNPTNPVGHDESFHGASCDSFTELADPDPEALVQYLNDRREWTEHFDGHDRLIAQ